VFRSPQFQRIQIWCLSNGKDFINVTHLCPVEPPPEEIAEANQIAHSLLLGPGDADEPSTFTKAAKPPESPVPSEPSTAKRWWKLW
jgi:hypothetical protein